MAACLPRRPAAACPGGPRVRVGKWLVGLAPLPIPLAAVVSFDSLLPYLLLLPLAALLWLSVRISGAEVAFFSLSLAERTHCQTGDARERQVAALLDNPRALLATMLVGNHLFNVSLVVLATYFVGRVGGFAGVSGWVGAAMVVLATWALVFAGELIPKVYGRQKSLAYAKSTVGLVRWAHRWLHPFTTLLLALTQAVEKLAERRGYRITVSEIEQAIEQSVEEHADTQGGEQEKAMEQEILKGIVGFGQLTARQLMRARVDITAFDASWDFHQLMDKINKFGYSRVPVFRGSIDHIEGILYSKDLIPHLHQPDTFAWQPLLRPGYFIPESKKANDLLDDFQRRRVHMAIVVDEYGGTRGLITLEDIMEEIVGEIHDEFDEETTPYRQIDTHAYLFEGKIPLHDFCKVLGLATDHFDNVKGDGETLAGLLLQLFARLPRVGEQVALQPLTFTVAAVDKRKIKQVQVRLAQSVASA